MACLLPRFNCPSSSSSFSAVKSKDRLCFRVQCVISQMTAMVDVQEIQITSSLAQPPSFALLTPLPYLKRNSEVNFGRESLQTDEEVVVAAAAAEAIALARAAVKFAKDAAQMIGSSPTVKLDKSESLSSEADILRLERARLNNMENVLFGSPSISEGGSVENVGIVDHPFTTLSKPDGETQNCPGKRGISNVMDKESKHPLAHFSKRMAVKSGRQDERRARRARGAEKTAASVIPVKSISSSRKKRAALQEIDYSDPLRYLRSTTNSSKLLTTSEELELSKGIQVLLKLEKLQEELVERNGGQPTFSQWASAAGLDQKTLRKRLNYGILCKDKMVKSNIRLVISIAKNYQGVGMNLQDLVQEGCRGLVKGTEKFDASKGFKFSTYAHWWIRQAVRRSLSDQSRTIRLPVHMVEATYRVREARKQLYSENGRYPDNKEVAEATGLSMRRLMAVMLTPKAPRSLDQKIGLNMNLKPSEVIAHPDAETTEEVLIKQLMKQDLYKVLDSINQREKQVVMMRFGLDDGRMKTLQEIGEAMGVSRERVRQIESCAFRKLKSKRRTNNLRQYLIS